MTSSFSLPACTLSAIRTQLLPDSSLFLSFCTVDAIEKDQAIGPILWVIVVRSECL